MACKLSVVRVAYPWEWGNAWGRWWGCVKSLKPLIPLNLVNLVINFWCIKSLVLYYVEKIQLSFASIHIYILGVFSYLFPCNTANIKYHWSTAMINKSRVIFIAGRSRREHRNQGNFEVRRLWELLRLWLQLAFTPDLRRRSRKEGPTPTTLESRWIWQQRASHSCLNSYPAYGWDHTEIRVTEIESKGQVGGL